MKQFISWQDIEQYRNVIKYVTLRSTYTGKDSDGNSIYDDNLPKPTLRFNGTVKLHGSNASVCLCNEEMWTQSREQIITPERDNAGFARFVEEHSPVFRNLFVDLVAQNSDLTLNEHSILAIFGEWAGKGIQSGTAISQIDKAFFIFGARLVQLNEDNKKIYYWLDSSGLKNEDSRIFNVQSYETYTVDIDFNDPEAQKDYLAELTRKVEEECPIAKAFGISGVGEGIVWWANFKGDRIYFKIKGEKHQVAKTKEIVPVDVEKLNSIEEFVNYAVTENRFMQAVTTVVGNPQEAEMKYMGEVLKWMHQDILKEESDTIEASGLSWKELAKYVTDRTRQMFIKLMGV